MKIISYSLALLLGGWINLQAQCTECIAVASYSHPTEDIAALEYSCPNMLWAKSVIDLD